MVPSSGPDFARGFAPVAREDARVLVLGSVPSVKSMLAAPGGQYYGNPLNAFWRLMEQLLGDGATLTYPERLELVLSARFALWDVLASATRPGSLDASIVRATEVPNDIAGFLDAHPSVTHVFFNGATAEHLFRRHNGNLLAERVIVARRLPSTSSAHAIPFAEKLTAWRAATDAATG